MGELLALRGLNQTQLAEQLGTTQSMVSAWKSGAYACPNHLVFRIEELLEVQPGTLGRHLNIYPYDRVALRRVMTVEEAVLADDQLDEHGRRAVLAVYRVYLSGDAAEQTPA